MPPRLTETELNVMRVLWEKGELKPAQIQAAFGKPIQNNALRGVLTILVEKGHLTRRRVGKAFFYKPLTRKESAFRSLFRQMVQTFWNGSTEAMLAHLIREEKLSERDWKKLKAISNPRDET